MFGGKNRSINHRPAISSKTSSKSKFGAKTTTTTERSTQEMATTSPPTSTTTVKSFSKSGSNRMEYLRNRYNKISARNATKVASTTTTTTTSTTTTVAPKLSTQAEVEKESNFLLHSEANGVLQLKPVDSKTKWRGYQRPSTTAIPTTMIPTTTTLPVATVKTVPVDQARPQIEQPNGISYHLEGTVPTSTPGEDEDYFRNFQFIYPDHSNSFENFDEQFWQYRNMAKNQTGSQVAHSGDSKVLLGEAPPPPPSQTSFQNPLYFQRIVSKEAEVTTPMPEVVVTIENRYIYYRNGTTMLHKPIAIVSDANSNSHFRSHIQQVEAPKLDLHPPPESQFQLELAEPHKESNNSGEVYFYYEHPPIKGKR